ncbi:MAG: FAD:protein FMN transferase, partial [Negativicutes bacterium]|nr:FAD:protein FMN transferase [Negativicutes bacterium]
IDLGGVGKAYMLQAMAEAMVRAGAESGLINFGGDVRVIGRRPDGQPWRIGLQDPDDSQQVVAVVTMSDWIQASTSGDYQRYSLIEGRRYCHLIDPFTGYPADRFRSVTVLSRDGMPPLTSAALFLMPLDQGRQLAESYNMAVIWLLAGNRVIMTEAARSAVELRR